jgi:hypothetical protein
MSETIVIVTVRHPDFGNETDVFGSDEIKVIDIDLGSSFDVTKIGEGDWDEVLEWAQSLYAEADECGNKNAAAHIKAVAEETLAECLPYGHEDCAVSDYITGKKKLDIPA